jgi:antirestriction protein ArdC
VESFKSREGFLATLLHECGHATGHRSRLARDFSGRFGSEAYAFEELVAELCSAFSQATLGIRADIEHHASYIQSWQRVLKQDKHAFVKACSLAQAATDYLVGEPQEEHQDEQDNAALAQAA